MPNWSTDADLNPQLKASYTGASYSWLATTSEKSVTVVIKQRVHALIEALPDDATWRDLLSH